MNGTVRYHESFLLALTSLFVGSLVVSTVVARKPVFIGSFLVNAGVFVYSFTFAITAIVTEIWGKETARRLVIAGFFGLAISYFWMWFGVVVPGTPFWQGQEAFQSVLGNSVRFMTAGIIAYLLAQFYDVWAFAFLRKRTGNRHLWLRTNVSIVPAVVIDTIVFSTIGFYGILPLPQVMGGILVVKIAIAALCQAGVYFGVWYLRRQPVHEPHRASD